MSNMESTADINFSPLLRRYTLEELWALPEPGDRAWYELIGGFLFLVLPPEHPHGDVVSHLAMSFIGFLVNNNIDGDTYFPHEAIINYDNPTYLEPDLMYVSRELGQRMGTKRTSADIVFEILSPRTSLYERTTKADTYLALGVQELWLMDPITTTIEVRRTGKISRYSRGQHAKSRVLEGYEISVDELFAGLTEE